MIKITGTDIKYAKDEEDTRSDDETNFSDRHTLQGSGSSAVSVRIRRDRGERGANNEGGSQDNQ